MISERSFEVLRAIVQDYVSTREPVGSKALLERHGFGVSSATIRNDMSLLEEEGLIHAPHTSAGRVPTPKGYRFFIDTLLQVQPLGYARTYRLFASSDAAHVDRLSGLQPPALFLTGELDPNSTPVMSEAMARLAPRSRLDVVPGARHMMNLTHADRVNASLRRFLAGANA